MDIRIRFLWLVIVPSHLSFRTDNNLLECLNNFCLNADKEDNKLNDTKHNSIKNPSLVYMFPASKRHPDYALKYSERPRKNM